MDIVYRNPYAGLLPICDSDNRSHRLSRIKYNLDQLLVNLPYSDDVDFDLTQIDYYMDEYVKTIQEV